MATLNSIAAATTGQSVLVPELAIPTSTSRAGIAASLRSTSAILSLALSVYLFVVMHSVSSLVRVTHILTCLPRLAALVFEAAMTFLPVGDR